MKNIFSTYVITLLILIFSMSLFAQDKEKGRLADFEEEIKNNSDDNDDEDQSSGFIAFDGSPRGIFNVLIITEDELKRRTWYKGYSDYPYSSHSIGVFSEKSLKTFSIISELEYFHHNMDLTGINFNSRLSPYPLFTFEFRYTDLTEKMKTRYDHLKLYDIFINYNRLKHERISFWWGIGMKGILGDRPYNGFAINAGIEIFPIAPVSLSSNFNLGFLNGTEVYDFSIKLKYHIERFQLSLGYQKFAVGLSSINGITFGFGFYL
ncbi:hypothetical protein ACFLSX_05260 [Calditrichota bacterium]